MPSSLRCITKAVGVNKAGSLFRQAVLKRDALLRQSEADLVQARDKIRGKAAEAERHAATVQALQADLRQAKKDKRDRENECGKLRTQLLQVRDELKEARSSCRDTGEKPQVIRCCGIISKTLTDFTTAA